MYIYIPYKNTTGRCYIRIKSNFWYWNKKEKKMFIDEEDINIEVRKGISFLLAFTKEQIKEFVKKTCEFKYILDMKLLIYLLK